MSFNCCFSSCSHCLLPYLIFFPFAPCDDAENLATYSPLFLEKGLNRVLFFLIFQPVLGFYFFSSYKKALAKKFLPVFFAFRLSSAMGLLRDL